MDMFTEMCITCTDSEEVLAAKEKQRLGLLKSLSRSIEEVQFMFANQSAEHPDQAYIGDCRPAHRLCAQFEDILRHGLKPGWFGGETTFWPVVLKVSREQAIQYIKGLQYAQTDNGRCRAWIRLAVNECSLENYINVICHDSWLLSYYYETHSFVRSHEMVSALTQLLVGLTELTFKLVVDTASLESKAVNSVPLKLKVVDEPKQANKGKERKLSTESKENGSVPENTSGSDDSLPAPIAEPPCNPKQNGEEDIQELPARTPADIQKLQDLSLDSRLELRSNRITELERQCAKLKSESDGWTRSAGLTLTWSKKLARLFSSLGGGDNSIESVMSSTNDPEVEVHAHENSEPKFYSPTSHNNVISPDDGSALTDVHDSGHVIHEQD